MDLPPNLEKAAQRAFKNISARLTKVRMSNKEIRIAVEDYLIDECGLDEDDAGELDAACSRVVALLGDKMPSTALPPPSVNTSRSNASQKQRPRLAPQDQQAIENIPYCFIPLSEKVVYAPEAVTNGVMDAPLKGGAFRHHHARLGV